MVDVGSIWVCAYMFWEDIMLRIFCLFVYNGIFFPSIDSWGVEVNEGLGLLWTDSLPRNLNGLEIYILYINHAK